MADAVSVEVDGGVAVITINRPEARNAVNEAVARGVAAAIDELDPRPDVAALVLTGAGGTFCAGMDLKGFLTGENPAAGGRGFGGITHRPPATPAVAAIEGYALAGGFEIALACDLIVASEEATFGLPEVTRGLIAAAGGLFRLPRRVPYHLAMAATKRVIVESADWPAGEAFARQDAITRPVFTSADARASGALVATSAASARAAPSASPAGTSRLIRPAWCSRAAGTRPPVSAISMARW